MPTQPNAAEILIGAGKLYFDRFDTNGFSTGMRFLGEASKFEITPSVEKAEIWDHTKAARTKLAQLTKTQTHSVSIEMAEYSSENIALALLGTVAFYTQTGGVINGEVLASSTAASATVASVAALQANSVLQTQQRNISAVTLNALVGATVTALAQGTDYEIEDAIEGSIRIIQTANFPAGMTALSITYTAAAMTVAASKKQVTAGAMPQILGRIKFVGDPVAGRARTVDAWRVHVEPASALGLISDDPSNISLSGEVLNDSANHPNSPLYLVTSR